MTRTKVHDLRLKDRRDDDDGLGASRAVLARCGADLKGRWSAAEELKIFDTDFAKSMLALRDRATSMQKVLSNYLML